MRKFFASLVVLVLALAVMPAALAAENEPLVLEVEPIMAQPVFEQQEGAALLNDLGWDGSYSTYYDLLSRAEKEIYDKMLAAFRAFAEDMDDYDLTDETGLLYRTRVGYEAVDETGNPIMVYYEYWRINDVVVETREYSEDTFTSWYYEKGDAVARACSALAFDHPEFFWIRQGIAWFSGDGDSVSIIDGKVTTRIDAGFIAYPKSDTAKECAELQEQMDDVINGIIRDVQGLDSTTEKLEYVDDWLAANNQYNQKAAAHSGYINKDETPWSIVGALLKGKDGYSPVCEGYAKAFQLLCHKIGLPCLQVSGDTYSLKEKGDPNANYVRNENGDYVEVAKGEGDYSRGAHMWNVVRIDGTWYFIDPTWNDPLYGNETENSDRDYSSRAYFLIDWPESHVADMAFAIPECGTSYFDFDAALVDQIIETMKKYPDRDLALVKQWELGADTISGFEVGTGTMMVVLFDDKGMMLDCVTCEVAYTDWRDSGQNVYTVSGIDPELLDQAKTIVRMNVDTEGYSPLKAVYDLKTPKQ